MLYVDGIPTGTCRVFWDDQQQSYVIGRGAVRKAFKGNHYGTVLLKEAEKDWGKTLALAAQVRVKPFYESLGLDILPVEKNFSMSTVHMYG